MKVQAEQYQLWQTWLPFAVIAYALWRLGVYSGRALPAWQSWHAGALERFPHEHEYHFWQSSSSAVFMLLLPLPLLMNRASVRARWVLYVLWAFLMLGTILLDLRAQALSPY